METILTTDPAEAAAIIGRGGIVAFPTETVYGLGADVFNEQAVRGIFEAKKRPPDNPLIAHVADREQMERLVEEIPPFASTLIDRFFPGPLTLVLKKRDEVPLIATAGLDTTGVRMPRNELARQFLAACGTPVVAPSANLSGRPSPTTWQAVYEDLNGRIDCILQGDPTEIGLESTVVDCTGDRPIILRQGGITVEDLRSVVPEAVSDASGELSARSPGLRHKHYAPRAKVVIIDSPDELLPEPEHSAYIGIRDLGVEFTKTRILGSLNEYAHELFEFFRECDRNGIATIYCEAVPEEGIGVALMDRIRRAAQG
ncbi:MAG TPA: L-threonylcarbamoyladenylate synthase [Pyrinomonadaceae bacterium]